MNWIDYSTSLKQDLVFLIKVLQKPPQITAGKMFHLNLTFFMGVSMYIYKIVLYFIYRNIFNEISKGLPEIILQFKKITLMYPIFLWVIVNSIINNYKYYIE